MTFGSGQAPYKGYALAVAGGAGGSTVCAGSMPSLGGSAARGGSIQCAVVGGFCTPTIYERGVYSNTAAAITDISTACTGGTPTWTISYQAGGGTPAILAGHLTTIIIAAAITAKGDVLGVDTSVDATSAIRFSTGGILTFDFTSSTNTPIYNMGVQTAANGRTFDTDGTCTPATCKILTTGTGAWRIPSGITQGPLIQLHDMTLQNLGDVSTLGIYLWFAANETFNFSGNKVSKMGCANFGGIASSTTPSITISNNVFTGSIPCNYVKQTNGTKGLFQFTLQAGTGGTRLITGNVSDIALVNSNGMSGMTFTGNVIESTGETTGYTQAVTWTSYSNNAFLDTQTGNGSNDYDVSGNVDHNIFYMLGDEQNWHLNDTPAFSTSLTYNIYGRATPMTADSGEIGGLPASGTTQNFDYNVILPDSLGMSWAEPGGSPGGSLGTSSAIHNYWLADYGQNAPGFGFYDVDETTSTRTGEIAAFRCNTLWNPVHTNSFMKMTNVLHTPTTTDPISVTANVDYNYGRGSGTTQASCTGCTGQTNGYAAHWSTVTPGIHDNNAIDPGVDYTRTIATFPTDYLQTTPTQGTWSSATDYALNDTVSDTQATYFYSKAIIYTCIFATGCSHLTATRPASGVLWMNYWEPYGVTWLKTEVAARSTFVDGALQVLGVNEDTACTPANPCDAITAMRHWIYAGLRASNALFVGACPDGKNIGPMQQAANRVAVRTP